MAANKLALAKVEEDGMAAKSQMVCPQCGVNMNHHCDKLVYGNAASEPASTDGGAIVEFHTCPECGGGASRQL